MHTAATNRDKHHRVPAEIISHAVWRYGRVGLSYRDVEELLFVRGVTVLDILVQRRYKKAAKQFFRKLFKGFVNLLPPLLLVT